MLEFHLPVLSDKLWVDEVLHCSRHRGCLYTFAQLSLWADKYNTRICRVGDALCGIAGTDEQYYLYPAGKYDIKEIVELLSADAEERGVQLRFSAAEEWQWKELDAAFHGRFCEYESRSDFDYIYRAENLARLAGRKYHSKRNHIAKFSRAYPDWSCEEISCQNVDECLAMAQQWLEENSQADVDGDLMLENQIIERALNDMEGYGLEGVLIRVSGKVVAFAIGERLNDNIYDIHFEKALRQYAEGYTVINREFAERIAENFELINREEDLGLEGLRKAKLSYHPEILLKKYLVTEVR